MKTRILLTVLAVTLVITVFAPGRAHARGHDGFYMGVGVLTMPQFSTEHRMTVLGGSSPRLKFYPGFGGWLLLGYDIPNSMWGIQMPFEYQYFKLNGQEWTSQIGSTLEAVMRVAQWANGWEFHVLGGLGWPHLFEGKIGNQTAATGMTAEIGPGFSWFFKRDDSRASLTFELPLRYTYFFGNNLSRNGTSVFAIPVRIGVTFAF